MCFCLFAFGSRILVRAGAAFKGVANCPERVEGPPLLRPPGRRPAKCATLEGWLPCIPGDRPRPCVHPPGRGGRLRPRCGRNRQISAKVVLESITSGPIPSEFGQHSTSSGRRRPLFATDLELSAKCFHGVRAGVAQRMWPHTKLGAERRSRTGSAQATKSGSVTSKCAGCTDSPPNPSSEGRPHCDVGPTLPTSLLDLLPRHPGGPPACTQHAQTERAFDKMTAGISTRQPPLGGSSPKLPSRVLSVKLSGSVRRTSRRARARFEKCGPPLTKFRLQRRAAVIRLLEDGHRSDKVVLLTDQAPAMLEIAKRVKELSPNTELLQLPRCSHQSASRVENTLKQVRSWAWASRAYFVFLICPLVTVRRR